MKALLDLFLFILATLTGGSSNRVPIGSSDRSPLWGALRNGWVKVHNSCSACGTKDNLEVHHVVPFSVNPKLELDLGNLLTLCSSCHLTFGHLRNYQSWNPTVRYDADHFLARVQNRPMLKEIDSGK